MSAMTDRSAQMNGGACMELPIEVVDKYFAADIQDAPFQHYTARAICGQCAVQAACLTEAIEAPGILRAPEGVVRAGYSGYMITRLRRRHFLSGESSMAIAREVLTVSDEGRTIVDIPFLRKGKFADAELLEGPLS